MLKSNKTFELNTNASIDSLKLRLRLSKVEVLDASILDTKTKYIISNATGEIIDESQIKHLAKEIQFNNYTIKVAIVSQYDFNLKINIDYLDIFLHTKILEEDYFEGVQMNNIERIYQKLIDAKVFKVTFEDFLLSSVNDIDIKKDFIADKIQFKDLTTYLKKIASSSNRRNVGVHKYANGTIEFNTRKTSKPSHPFLKLYDKVLEAEERKSEFFEFYFDMRKLKDTKRIEATLKTTKEIKTKLELHEATLVKLLATSSELLNSVIADAVNKNLKEVKTIQVRKTTNERQSNLNKLIYIHIANCVQNQNMFFEDALRMTLEHFADKQNRYRMKKLITQIYLDEIADEKNKKVNVERLRLLNFIGWENLQSSDA